MRALIALLAVDVRTDHQLDQGKTGPLKWNGKVIRMEVSLPSRHGLIGQREEERPIVSTAARKRRRERESETREKKTRERERETEQEGRLVCMALVIFQRHD